MKKILNQENLMVLSRISLLACIVAVTILSLIPMNIRYYKYFNATLISFMCFTITYLAVTILRHILQFYYKGYSTGGNKESWYKETIKWMGVDWMSRAAAILLKEGMISKSKVVMASPSANVGMYEKELFNYLCDERVKATLVASDLEEINHSERSFNRGHSKYIYVNGKNNALAIKDTLVKAGIEEKLDVIWDIKGCLWYSFPPFFLTKKARIKITNAFDKYLEVLKDNGIIVIDNISTSVPQLILYYILYMLIGRFGNGEQSTYQKLRKNLKRENTYCRIFKNKTRALTDYLNKHFEVHFYEFINKNNKKISFVCLKKKSYSITDN